MLFFRVGGEFKMGMGIMVQTCIKLFKAIMPVLLVNSPVSYRNLDRGVTVAFLALFRLTPSRCCRPVANTV